MKSLDLVAIALLAGLAAGGCQKDKTPKKGAEQPKPAPSADGGGGGGGGGAAEAIDLDSKEILARAPVAEEVDVKHILLGWKDLEAVYQGQMDPRAGKRNNAEAAALAKELAAKLRANPGAIDALVKQHSEDPGSLEGNPYTIDANAQFVPPFKQLALRLKEGEVGIVRTEFGYHVMVRAAADPLESADILARPGADGPLHVQHVLIGWKDVEAARQRPVDPRAAQRSKADADALAKQVLDKVRAGGDMAALMKEYSEDPGSKDNARVYQVSKSARLVPPFKDLSLRLQLGEAGLVKSPFGWHVIKRVPEPPPPPPDALDSTAVLKRKPVTATAKVKHILLGWKDANAGDPRGAGRERPALEALVKKTVATLKKGKPIEPLMAELSEDPGSAASGGSYDVTPDASLVDGFKDLSLRLNVGEVGVVKTQFGIHIIKRVE